VCALEEELSLVARAKAARVQAEHIDDVAGEEASVETATLAETPRQTNDNGVGGE